MKLPDDVRAWLARPHDVADLQDASARAPDPVAERLLSLTRPLRPARALVAGAVVVHDRSGTPFAAALDGCLVVRLRAVPGTLVARPVVGLSGWLALDPFPPDVTFAKGQDVLRHVLTRAYEDAGR
jgi:hypothetical protein